MAYGSHRDELRLERHLEVHRPIVELRSVSDVRLLCAKLAHSYDVARLPRTLAVVRDSLVTVAGRARLVDDREKVPFDVNRAAKLGRSDAHVRVLRRRDERALDPLRPN